MALSPEGEAPAFMHEAYGEVSPEGIGHYPVVLAKMAETHLVGHCCIEPDGVG